MSGEPEQRKLAAIMFTDMVGYSALAQRNDKLALELLEEHWRLLREIFPRYPSYALASCGSADTYGWAGGQALPGSVGQGNGICAEGTATRSESCGSAPLNGHGGL